jgi:Na+-transporting NADH:ubiquinone oxidoreductase subunit NqrE
MSTITGDESNLLDADLLTKLERLQIDLVIRELANFVAVLAAFVQILRRLSPHILI